MEDGDTVGHPCLDGATSNPFEDHDDGFGKSARFHSSTNSFDELAGCSGSIPPPAVRPRPDHVRSIDEQHLSSVTVRRSGYLSPSIVATRHLARSGGCCRAWRLVRPDDSGLSSGGAETSPYEEDPHQEHVARHRHFSDDPDDQGRNGKTPSSPPGLLLLMHAPSIEEEEEDEGGDDKAHTGQKKLRDAVGLEVGPWNESCVFGNTDEEDQNGIGKAQQEGE
jgi:hypothetical protein